MSEQMITVGQQSVLVRTWGEGPAVLVLHGWGSSSAPWEPLALILAERGFRVIVPDLPGFGQSAPPTEAWGVDGYAAFITQLCLVLHISSCHIMAHSFGGRVALRLASSRAIPIDKLILCSSAGLRPQDLKSRVKRLVFFILSKTGRAAARLPLLSGFQPAARRILYRGAGEHDYEKTSGVMKQVFTRVIQEDLSGDLAHVHVPTLLIWGQRDRLTPLGDGYRMHRGIPGSHFRVIADTGHNAYKDRPEETSAFVLEFLKVRT